MATARMVAVALATVLVATSAAGCDASRSESTITTTASQQTESEVARTMRSLRRVDDLPLYAMTYVGDYDALAPPVPMAQASPFGCSLFIASGDPARPLFARNFDWDPHPVGHVRHDHRRRAGGDAQAVGDGARVPVIDEPVARSPSGSLQPLRLDQCHGFNHDHRLLWIVGGFGVSWAGFVVGVV